MKTRALLFIAFLTLSCQKQDVVPTPSQEYQLSLPTTPLSYFLPVKDEIPTLGRVLFYDKRLSINNTISCASCHKQNLAFSDNVAVSKGVNGHSTYRNTLPIQNITVTEGVISNIFWDGRQIDPKTAVIMPIFVDAEMGMNSTAYLLNKLAVLPEYQKLFKEAYGSEIPTTYAFSTALAWFVSCIRTDYDRFDLYNINGSTNKNLTEPLTDQELKGFDLFKTQYNCNACHHIEDKSAQMNLFTSDPSSPAPN